MQACMHACTRHGQRPVGGEKATAQPIRAGLQWCIREGETDGFEMLYWLGYSRNRFASCHKPTSKDVDGEMHR
jgi:hypothetical protein